LSEISLGLIAVFVEVEFRKIFVGKVLFYKVGLTIM